MTPASRHNSVQTLVPEGRKGGKGGGGDQRAPVEYPNTLQSVATARVIDVLSEGEIVGLVDGAKSIFLDDTPLQNDSGSYNFKGFSYEERIGLPDQDPIAGFPNVETEVSVGVEVKNGAPVTRQITDPDIDALRVKVRIPALVETDVATGDRKPTSVQIQVSVTPDGGAETTLVDDTISGKTISPYERAYRVALPAAGAPWDVKMTRVTADSTSDTLTNATFWSSYTELIDAKLIHPDTALIAVSVDAKQFGTAIPQRAYEVKGLKVNIPSNYYPLGPNVTNMLTRSEEFEHADWLTAGSATTAAGTGTAPDGTSTADDLTYTATGDRVYQSITETVASNSYTFSVWLSGSGTIDIGLDDNISQTQYATVTLTGTLTRYSVSHTFASSAATSLLPVIERRAANTATAVVAWGAQLETGTSLSPYIKSVATATPGTDYPRHYDIGVWDGTFKLDWTDNPAWVLYDILVSSRYGLGGVIDATQIDKWGLYTIAQYCDELVDDGFGGQEARFTFNGVINSRQEAYTVVNSISSAFRGMIYWGSGAVTAAQDSPADPVKLISPANVVGGEFNYSGTALKARHSAALVTWNDPDDGYKPAIAVVEDIASIERYGLRQVDVAAFGATSKGQAYRFGRWILDSEKSEIETVTYSAALDHADVRPGDIISIADPAYAGVRFGGRAVSATTTQVTVDSAVTLEASETYTLSAVLADGTVEDRSVTNGPGSATVLTLDSALTSAPLAGAMWVLTASNVEPRKFRVIAVREVEKNIFEITALLHDPTKYARIESNLVLEAPDYSALPTGAILPPSGLATEEYLYRAGPSVKSAVTLSWSSSPDARVARYQVEVKEPGQSAFAIETTTSALSADILDTPNGDYEFRVTAIDGLGRHSDSVTLAQNILGMLGPPADVQDFNINIVGDSAHLSWSPVPDLDLSHYRIKYSLAVTGATWGSAVDLVARVSGTATSATVPALTGTYLIKAVDLSPNGGVESENAALIVSTVSDLIALNVVATVAEQPGFTGSTTNVLVLDSALQLDSAGTMDDWTTLDVVLNLIGSVVSSGTYGFGNTLDLSAVYTSRLKANINAFADNFSNVMTGWSTLSSVSPISGADPSAWNVALEARTTEDDPAGSPTWTAWKPFIIGDYKARAFEWRLQMSSTDPVVTPVVDTLEAEVDMPDRVEGADDVACPAAGLSVVFAQSFKARPAIAVSGQNMLTGDYVAITNQSASGFDARFFNSTGTGVARTMDWVAKGYGRVN